jgi:hypothetical protein
VKPFACAITAMFTVAILATSCQWHECRKVGHGFAHCVSEITK